MQVTTTSSTSTVKFSKIFPKAFPDMLTINIFLFLDMNTIGNCFRTCSSFKQASDKETFWKLLSGIQYGSVACEFIGDYVTEKTMTWKEAFRFGIPISQFLDNCQTTIWKMNASKIIKDNPHHNRRCLDERLPLAYARQGRYEFRIKDSFHIQVTKQGGQPYTLVGEEGVLLSHVRTYRDSVFALRYDGKIVQWNIHTRKQVALIDTSYSQEDASCETVRKLQATENRALAERDGFNIQDGRLFLCYSQSVERRPIDVIDLTNQNKITTLFCSQEKSEKMSIGTLANNKLYLYGWHEQGRGAENIVMFDFATSKQSRFLCEKGIPSALRGERHCFYLSSPGDPEQTLRVIDVDTWEVICRLPKTRAPEYACTFHNLSVCWTQVERAHYDYDIVVHDLSSGSILKRWNLLDIVDNGNVTQIVANDLLPLLKQAKPLEKQTTASKQDAKESKRAESKRA